MILNDPGEMESEDLGGETSESQPTQHRVVTAVEPIADYSRDCVPMCVVLIPAGSHSNVDWSG
jgi:hypothetical protein